jgi:hypothetical protein
MAAESSGRRAEALEKDVYVVWLLSVLFGSEFGDQLAFKGGTSLSKAYGVIDRFSEDVDLTYDVRRLTGAEPDLPLTANQADKISKIRNEKLQQLLSSHIGPLIQDSLAKERLDAKVEIADKTKVCQISIAYTPVATSIADRPAVVLEFAALGSGHPTEVLPIRCDMASALPNLEFPQATPRVLSIRRTFWEKATAAHVFCHRDAGRGVYPARHWYDLVAISKQAYFEDIIIDDIAKIVAKDKAAFFREKDVRGQFVSYEDAVNGNLLLVPDGSFLLKLEENYLDMIKDGVLPEGAPAFDQLIEECRRIEDKVNRIRSNP